jgi:hypothetical protein
MSRLKVLLGHCPPAMVVAYSQQVGGVSMCARYFAAIVVLLLVAGCATHSADVTAAYVSPMQYDAYTCPQLAEEAQRVSSHAAEASGAQDSQATKDAVATTVGVIVFWPSLFFIGGDKQNAAELARLKGEMDAIEQTSIRKKCGLQFRTAPPTHS